jgi:hypothetical protein
LPAVPGRVDERPYSYPTVILSAAKDLGDRETLVLPRSFAALRMTSAHAEGAVLWCNVVTNTPPGGGL